jgi:murein DD-endopeptidase MepM/ murein hydrolase activator NlpD
MHSGIDYTGPVGDMVRAAADGSVIEAGHSEQYGNLIVIDHGNGIATAYAHLADMKVGEGACVLTGETIAGRGNTGLSSEPHLHFEVRRDGTAVDPEPLLKSATP